MEHLPLPQQVTSTAAGPHRAHIAIEPCYPGYSSTLGNALRRALLSSLPGSAVTAVKITGVDHEFSTLPGVKEDVVDLLLNVKSLRIKVHAAEPITFTLKATGEREVTAADISTHSDVEILNPELHLATLTDKKASLEMVFTAQQGRGYVTVESRDKEKLDIGTIAVDALYTPVVRVGYTVENVRVGQMTNYEKLTLDVETDGSLEPLAAVKLASQTLIDHFSVVTGGTAAVSEQAPHEAPADPEIAVGEDEPEPKAAGKKRGRPKKDSI